MRKCAILVFLICLIVAGVSWACDSKDCKHTVQGSCAPQAGSTSSKKGAAAQIKEVTLNVEGMHCASCIGKIDSVLRTTGAVSSVDVNLEKKICTIKYDAAKVTPQDLVTCINKNTPYKAGMK